MLKELNNGYTGREASLTALTQRFMAGLSANRGGAYFDDLACEIQSSRNSQSHDEAVKQLENEAIKDLKKLDSRSEELRKALVYTPEITLSRTKTVAEEQFREYIQKSKKDYLA